MEDFKKKINELADDFFDEMVEIRRHLHSNPELSEQEFKTAAFISAKLNEWGIEHKVNVGGTGIVAEIRGNDPDKKTVALRADMDALPITEENDIPYKSANNGVMHACGHDVHMTCLLGAVKILNLLKYRLTGTLRIIFQPSEEKFPGGALAMINEGVLKNPVPDKILGLHVLPTLEAGKIGTKAGKYMASTDEVYLTVKGKGGHAATPELNTDTVLIAAHIITGLQQIVSRHAPPGVPSVLSFGKVIANGRTNIIPDIVKIDGTFRTFDEKWRAAAHEKITTLAQGIAQSMEGDCEVFIDKGYPFLINDEKVTKEVTMLSKEFLGENNVVELETRMTAEDFAYYSHQIPACFYRLGVKNKEEKEIRNLHTSTFDVDETAIKTGMSLISWLALQL